MLNRCAVNAGLATSAVTENLPRKRENTELDVARIHRAVDDALHALRNNSSGAEKFDLKLELALRAIREELLRRKKARFKK